MFLFSPGKRPTGRRRLMLLTSRQQCDVQHHHRCFLGSLQADRLPRCSGLHPRTLWRHSPPWTSAPSLRKSRWTAHSGEMRFKLKKKQKKNSNQLIPLHTVLFCWLDEDNSHQEPVDIHEQQRQQESVEKKVEGDARHRLEAGYARGVQHFEREPVETKPKPERRGNARLTNRQ